MKAETKNNLPAYRRISDALRTMIRDRSMKTDDLLPSEAELCSRFSVSRMTARKAIDILVGEQRAYRVSGKGTFVGKLQKKNRCVKFVLPGPDSMIRPANWESQRLFASAVQEAHQLDYRMETIIASPDHRLESLKPELFASLTDSDNVLLTSIWFHPLFPILVQQRCNVAAIWPQYAMAEHNRHAERWFKLLIDDIGAAEDATNYLLTQGRKNIVCFTILGAFKNSAHPLNIGYEKGLARHGVEVNPVLTPVVESHDYRNPGRIKNVLKDTFTRKHFNAILSTSYFIQETLAACAELGLKVPGDVAVISMSEGPELNDVNIPVSVMAWPFEEIGRETVRCFDRENFTPGEKIFRPSLIERESSHS